MFKFEVKVANLLAEICVFNGANFIFVKFNVTYL